MRSIRAIMSAIGAGGRAVAPIPPYVDVRSYSPLEKGEYKRANSTSRI